MAHAKASKTTSIDSLLTDLRHNPEFRKAERLVGPFYELAVEIINQRAKLGMTQKDLAERAGTFQSRISKIESGEHDMRLSTLIAIAEALGSELLVKMIPIADTIYRNEQPYHAITRTVTTIGESISTFATQGEYYPQTQSAIVFQ